VWFETRISRKNHKELHVSMTLANDAKEQIRQAVDIVDLVGGYINLHQRGHVFKGICPWHEDTDPSLQIRQDRQTWHCFVCGDGGDIFSFVMKKEGVEFREALGILAERAGIELTATRGKPAEPGSPEDKKTLFAAARWAEERFHQHLLHGSQAAEAREYLQDRGFTAETIERYALGYAENSWSWLLDQAGAARFSPQVLTAVGLSVEKESTGRFYDAYRGRVIFPIRDTQKRTIAFGGRILPSIAKRDKEERGREPAKYINSPETRLFSKSEQLYALELARDAIGKKPQGERELVIVEGYTDAIMAGQQGVDNVVAVLGTALGERHIKVLQRFADSVVLVLDGDAAGQRRANEVLKFFLAAQMDLRILTLPDGLDPCDFVRDQGPDAFRQLLSTSLNALDHKLKVATQGVDLANDIHKSQAALEDVLAAMAEAPRPQAHSPYSHRLREQQMLARLAREFRLQEADLRTRLGELRRNHRGEQHRPSVAATPRVTLNTLRAQELELFEILTQYPEHAAFALGEITADQLSEGLARRWFAAYRTVFNKGETPEFNRVLSVLSFEDQAPYVAIDERAAAKTAESLVGPLEGLQQVIEGFHRIRTDRAQNENLAKLETGKVDQEGEDDLLNQVIQQARSRHGITPPTDG